MEVFSLKAIQGSFGSGNDLENLLTKMVFITIIDVKMIIGRWSAYSETIF